MKNLILILFTIIPFASNSQNHKFDFSFGVDYSYRYLIPPDESIYYSTLIEFANTVDDWRYNYTFGFHFNGELVENIYLRTGAAFRSIGFSNYGRSERDYYVSIPFLFRKDFLLNKISPFIELGFTTNIYMSSYEGGFSRTRAYYGPIKPSIKGGAGANIFVNKRYEFSFQLDYENFPKSRSDDISLIVDSITHVTESHLGSIEITLNPDYFYYWSNSSGIISLDEDIYNLIPGCYTLHIESNNPPCELDTTLCVEDLTGIKTSTSSDLVFYPNPTNTIFNLPATYPVDRIKHISARNAMGSKIILEKITDKKFIIQAGEGLFFIKIQLDDGSHHIGKILVVR